MFGSLSNKIQAAVWSNRSTLEKFLLVICSIFSLTIIILSSLVACHYQQKVQSTTDRPFHQQKLYMYESSAANRNDSPSLSTHILDVSRGMPVANVETTLYSISPNKETRLAMRRTDDNGKVNDILGKLPLDSGVYKLEFDVHTYFENLNQEFFYPTIQIIFNVVDPTEHFHIPIILSPYGYSTYRQM